MTLLTRLYGWLVVQVVRFLARFSRTARARLEGAARLALTKAEIKRKLDSGEYELRPIFKLRRLSLGEWDGLPEPQRRRIGSERRLVSVFGGHHLQAVNQRKRRNRAIMLEHGADYASGRQRRIFRKLWNRAVRVRLKIVEARATIPESQVYGHTALGRALGRPDGLPIPADVAARIAS
jgi:hypothetical protein